MPGDLTDSGCVAELLALLHTQESQAAWTRFLESYSSLILKVIHFFDLDEDQADECYLFVCQELANNRFRRLRNFDQHGPASFPTWLRAVIRNLCVDWYRHKHGRRRTFQSIARLPSVDQAVFHCVFEQGMSLDQTQFSLINNFPGLGMSQLEESLNRVQSSLGQRQRWLLSLRRQSFKPLRVDPSNDCAPSEAELSSSQASPETLAAFHEQESALNRALERLPNADRLIIRLRFEQELTLEQVARLTGLGSAQHADYRIRTILENLKKELA